MSYRLLSVINRLEGNEEKETAWSNRPSTLALFEEIIADALEVVQPGIRYQLFFDYNKVSLASPGVSVPQVMREYTLSYKDSLFIILAELNDKYKDHINLFRFDMNTASIHIYVEPHNE